MKKRLLTFLLAVLPLSSFAASGTAIPGGSQTTPFVINKPGAYYLAGNRVMTTKGDAVIKVAASDVTLDLNGFSLSYPDIQATGDGISVVGANIEIRNGSISTTPSAAINVGAYSNNVGLRVIDVRVADTTGINAQGFSPWIERCQIIDTRGEAIDLGYYGTAKDCVIRGVVKTNEVFSGHGVVIDDYCQVIGCTIDFTQNAGVVCGKYSVVRNNRISNANILKDPTSAGIFAPWSDFSTISGNTITTAHAAGIRVALQSVYTTIENNVIMGTRAANPQIGFGVVTSSGLTLLRGNTIRGNDAGMVSGSHIDGGGNVSN